MKKYAYKGKVVHVMNQMGDQVIYSDGSSKSSALKTVSSSVFFKVAKEIKPQQQNLVVVAGTAPVLQKNVVPEQVVEEPYIEQKSYVDDTYLIKEEPVIEKVLEVPLIKEEIIVEKQEEIVKEVVVKKTRAPRKKKEEVKVIIEEPKIEVIQPKKRGSVNVYEDYV